VTGIDDHSRFCVLARLLERATARPVCDALGAALAGHGPPQAILTDNGKVFTARFGPGPGPVLFDRLCHDNGIRHLLTAPYSPTTDTGVIGRPSLASADKGRAILESLTRSSRITLPCLPSMTTRHDADPHVMPFRIGKSLLALLVRSFSTTSRPALQQ
jgi:transposase InsO family protein